MGLEFRRERIRPGDRVSVAVSGGADSVALLLATHAANIARREALGVGLSVAHVDHGLRGAEADGDLEFVRELCIRLGLQLHLHRASVPKRVAATRESVEEAARAIRYGFFESLIASGEANTVLTAHTLDDQAETVLMKLLRGGWTEGLSGIHPVVTVKGGAILRPLLGVRRTEIVAFLREARQAWREDTSNAETIYTRNRLRHQVMPLLREFNPVVDRMLGNVAELAREEEAHWQRAIGQLLPGLLLPGRPVRGGGRAVSTTPGEAGVAIELARLRALDVATRRRVLRAATRGIGSRLSFDETERLMAMCGQGPAPAAAQLAGGARAQRSVRELRLFREGR